ncbi:MAG: hypothetical protein Q8P86_01900 [bacterium]|nr:hypothetical protein [bacterium]
MKLRKTIPVVFNPLTITDDSVPVRIILDAKQAVRDAFPGAELVGFTVVISATAKSDSYARICSALREHGLEPILN